VSDSTFEVFTVKAQRAQRFYEHEIYRHSYFAPSAPLR
jgi:hypothetical protein